MFKGNDFPQSSEGEPIPGFDAFNPSISVSGDYAQTNNCPPTFSPTGPQIQGCIITVTFAPTGTGPKDGTLSTGTDASVFELCRCPAATGPTVALTGSGVTTSTPPALPLLLSASSHTVTLEKKVTLRAITNNDSTVVVSGGVKKTTKRLAAGDKTKVKAKLKNLKRLKEKPGRPKVKIKFAATDEFGQTATEKIKATFCPPGQRPAPPRPGHGLICR